MIAARKERSMKDLLEHLNSYLATTLRKAEAEDDHDIALVCMDAQAKLAEVRLKRYRARVERTSNGEVEQ